jgi:hypothetical protein
MVQKPARCRRDYYEAINSRFKTDGFDSDGRFQPITIPQRSRYSFSISNNTFQRTASR